MKPTYQTTYENGHAVCRATAFGQVIATEKEAGLTKKAESAALKSCKARVKYLFGQAKA